MKKNTIMSIMSLVITTFLLFFIVSAWYVSNKEVSVNGIFGNTAGDGYSLKLQRGTYNSSTNKWSWEDTESLSFANVSPGNKLFFRIVMNTNEGESYNFSAKFDGISSSLTEDKLVVNNGYVAAVVYGGLIDLYKIVDNAVTVTNDSSVTKTLYTIDAENNISLADYKIQNAFLFYSLETTEPANTTLPSTGGQPFFNELDNPLQFDFGITAESSQAYYYFALEFNENRSIETIDGVPQSNMYMYQSLSISCIQIKEN